MAIIKCISLHKEYANGADTSKALTDCNIEIKEGTFVTITGVKASGKSSLLRILGGYERPSFGVVYINNHNIYSYSDDELALFRRKEVGYLFQNDSLIPDLTVHENIILLNTLVRTKYEKDYYEDLVDRLQISNVLSRFPKQLSTNQLLSVTYARALINKPKIILMEEQNNYHCEQMDRAVLDYLLYTVYQYHKTLIMVTNNPEICAFADHFIKLNNGFIVEDRVI
jgi:putative ABC transport system ATP-binding protein